MTALFTKKKLAARFTLDASAGTFTADGSNTIDVANIRMRATLVNSMSTTMDSLELEVWGLPLSVTNALTILQNGFTQGVQNQIELTAGDENGMALMFSGQIFTGWGDFSGQPEASFICQAHTGLTSVYTTVPPTSFKGSVDAATVAKQIAALMTPPLTLQNNGVTAQLTDVNFPGDAMQQLRSLAVAAGFEFATDEPGILAIWPQGSPRDLAQLEVSQATGLVGWPSYNDKGLSFTTFFNPAARVNAPVNVTSQSTPANGIWYPFHIQHDLEAEFLDGGRWFTHFDTQRFNAVAP